MPLDFKELFDHLNSGVAVYEARDQGEDFFFVAFNRAGERIDHIRREEVLGKSVLEIFPTIKSFGLFEVFQRVWKTGKPEGHPIGLYQDGRISGWRENYVYQLPSGEIVAIYEDVTELKQAEEALRESESRYRAVVELSNDGIALVQGDIHIYVNPKMVEIFGYGQPEEIIGQPVFSMVHPDDRQRVGEINRRRQQEKESPGRYEFKGLNKNGEPVAIEVSARKIIFRGEPASLVFMRDISQRKEIEEQLRRAGDEWQQTFDSMSDGVSLHDLDGNILKANKTLGRMLKIPPEAMIHKKCYQLFHGASEPISACPMMRSFDTGAIEYEEVFEPRLNCWISVTASPLMDEEKRIKGVVHVVRNITERKREEETLRALSLVDELTGLYNRRGFISLAEHALKTARRLNRFMWLLFADLDGLKDINDALGHREGDQALMETAGILKKTFREADILGRLGGDEFVALGMETAGTTNEQVMDRLQQRLNDRNARDSLGYRLSLSLGFARFNPQSPVSFEELLAEADQRMYQEKQRKKLR
jgi:diguanylate cyclase (GGDEF)-like protein/PAS domain S-box-containing protein